MLKFISNNKTENKSKSISNSLYFGLNEIELRDICRHSIDTFENWARRLIDEQFKQKYGDEYFDHYLSKDCPLIKTEIKKFIEDRMKKNPGRFPRKIDAILTDDISYFFCRDDLYSNIFKLILEPFYSGSIEIRSVIERIVAIRNKLSHGNTISIHEAEQCICYTNDFIEIFKLYYKKTGKEKKYNVPLFIRMKDSFGNDVIRKNSDYSWGLDSFDFKFKVQLHSGEEYKAWVEVDSSYNKSEYSIFGEICYNYNIISKINGEEIFLKTNNKMVSYIPQIKLKLKTNKEWHKFGDYDDRIYIDLEEVLPPIKDTY